VKRVLITAMTTAILLVGCAANTAEESVQTTIATTAPTEDPSWYVENSEIETQTHGIVQMYELDGTYTDVTVVGDSIVLADNYGTTYLAALDTDTGAPVGSVRIGKNIALGDGGLQPTYNGIGYYDQNRQQAVILNAQLQEIQRIDMPEDMTGQPVFAAGGSELFYCAGKEIRALDIDLGITRLVKTLAYQEQSLLGSYFYGELLACAVTDQLGDQYTVYISAKTGQTVAQDNGLHTIYSTKNAYLGLRTDGVVEQFVVGNYNEPAQQLHAANGESVYPAVSLNGVVGWKEDQEGNVQLSLYDVKSGMRTGAIALTGLDTPLAACADDEAVWFITTDKATSVQSLYRWVPSKSTVLESRVYTSSVFTAESPNITGLEQCESRAKTLGSEHGVDIRVWERAVRNPGDYILEAEYQTEAIDACLDQLESVLSVFPDSFLYRSVKNQIRICIVRSISGDVNGAQYWYNGDAYIVLTPKADVWEELVSGIGYIVNSHTMGKSPIMDAWNGLNPEGFEYGTPDESYLEGDDRAFADLQSMQSVTDDRSHLFLYAITEGNEELFRSAIMQAKLRMLCQGIRDAWRWEKKTETYPWEQYLNEPIVQS